MSVRISPYPRLHLITKTQRHHSYEITRQSARTPWHTHWTVYKQKLRTMLHYTHLKRYHLDLTCDWRVSPRFLTLDSETSVTDWTWLSAKISYTHEQPWGDRLRTVIRNFECEPCVMALSIREYNFCYTNYTSCLWQYTYGGNAKTQNEGRLEIKISE